MYFAEHVHIARTQDSDPYFCKGQESEPVSESISSNVNEPLPWSRLEDRACRDTVQYVSDRRPIGRCQHLDVTAATAENA